MNIQSIVLGYWGVCDHRVGDSEGRSEGFG